jgi:hypothetical protein
MSPHLRVITDKRGFFVFTISDIISSELLQQIDHQLKEISNIRKHLIILFDLRNCSDIKLENYQFSNQTSINDNVQLDLLIVRNFGLNKATFLKIFHKYQDVHTYDFSEYAVAEKKAFELSSNQKMESIFSGPFSGVDKEQINIGARRFWRVHNRAWKYIAQNGNYFYKIDLIDSDILVSQPAGFIEQENSVNANVLFDKVVYELLGHQQKYYRVQDYTKVERSTFSARRDFTNYIMLNIDRIELMVFYGLNSTMKAAVRIGKLLHSAFSKVKIVETFEEAMSLVLEHKYGKGFFDSPQNINLNLNSVSKDLESNSIDNERHDQELTRVFEVIGKLLWSKELEIPQSSNRYYADIYQALDVLRADVSELMNKKETTINQLQKQQYDLIQDAKRYQDQIKDLHEKYEVFTRELQYEIRTPVHSIITSSELIQLTKNDAERKDYFFRMLDSSKYLFDKFRQQTDFLNTNINHGHLNNSILQMKHLVNTHMNIHKSQAEIKGIQVEVDSDILDDYYISDVDKLGSVIDHLLSCSIRNSKSKKLKFEVNLCESFQTMHKINMAVYDPLLDLKPRDKEILSSIFKGDKVRFEEVSQFDYGIEMLLCRTSAEYLGGQLSYIEKEEGAAINFEIILDLGVFSRDLNLLKSKKSIKHFTPFSDDSFSILLWTELEEEKSPEYSIFNQLKLKTILVNHQDQLYMNLSQHEFQLLVFEFNEKSDLENKLNLITNSRLNEKMKLCGTTTNVSLNPESFVEDKKLDYCLMKPYTIKSLVDVVKASRKVIK